MALLCVSLFAQEKAPTDQELLSKYNAMTLVQKIAILRFAYEMNNAIPELPFPDYGAVLDKDSGKLIVYPVDKEGKPNPSVILTIASLKYKIAFPTLIYDNFYKPKAPSWEKYVVFPLVCGAA